MLSCKIAATLLPLAGRQRQMNLVPPMNPPPPQSPSFARLRALFESRIAILDGAMGSMIQTFDLQEADFRGERLRDHPHDLKGNNDLLSLTRPDVIEGIHSEYFAAGADMVETNTFNSTSISQSDYGTESLAGEINAAAAAIALRAARKAEAAAPGRRCFVAGAIGPLNRTLSLSPDVNRPDYRAVAWDQVVAAYSEQARALIEGGVDALLIETIFDTLNAKAALFAVEGLFEEMGIRLPGDGLRDDHGRLRPHAFRPDDRGLLREHRPRAALLASGSTAPWAAGRCAPTSRSSPASPSASSPAIPTRACRTPSAATTRPPPKWPRSSADFAANGWVNLVGGCCGSTPAHIAAIAGRCAACRPARCPPPPAPCA